MLLLLQARGQVTATELAERLEVSPRTVYRDAEALSSAGVPIYAERGRAGGIRLLPGYRTDVTGLTQDEARALFVLTTGGAQAGSGAGSGGPFGHIEGDAGGTGAVPACGYGDQPAHPGRSGGLDAGAGPGRGAGRAAGGGVHRPAAAAALPQRRAQPVQARQRADRRPVRSGVQVRDLVPGGRLRRRAAAVPGVAGGVGGRGRGAGAARTGWRSPGCGNCCGGRWRSGRPRWW